MPPQIAALIEKATAYFKDLFANVVIIYGEKGIEPFKRPLVIAVPSLLILYAGIYSPISGKLSRTVKGIDNMTVVSNYAEEYEGVKARVSGLHRKLPLLKDKDDWLSYIINNSAKTAGVSVESQSAQRETEIGSYLVVSREVSTVTTYHKMGKWLAEIENSPIFLVVTDLNMQREDSGAGTVKVTLNVSTVFPRGGGL